MRSLLQAVLTISLFPLLVSPLLSSNSDIFKIIEKDGTVVYTDKPDPDANAKAIKLETTKFVSPSSILRQPKTSNTPPEQDYSSLVIISPEEKENLHNPDEIIVTIRVTPDLATGHKIQLLKNGKKTKTNTSGTFTLTKIHRGENKLKAQIIDRNNNVLYSSKSRTIYVYRHSILLTPKSTP